MNLMDMVMALIAVVFFTTISLVYNRSVWNQYDNLNNATLVVQGTQICHSILDEADAKLFARMIPFNAITTDFSFTRTVVCSHINRTFAVSAVAVDCDSLGNVLNNPPANNQFKSITVTVTGPRDLRRPIILRRLYTKTSMYS